MFPSADTDDRAGIWAGLGVAAKLYPVVLLPIFGLYYLAAGDRRALLRLSFGSLVALLLTIVPFLYQSTTPAELLAFLGYHRLRGLQIETLPAGLVMIGLKRGLTTGQIVFNYGALHFDSPWSTIALALLPFMFVATFGVVGDARGCSNRRCRRVGPLPRGMHGLGRSPRHSRDAGGVCVCRAAGVHRH